MKEKKLWLFFALSKDALVLNSQDRNIIEKDKNKSSALPAKEENVFWEQEKYPAIEIDYLAVREDKRTENNCNLGSAIIESIAQIAANDNLTSTLFLTVEALHTDYYRLSDFIKNVISRIVKKIWTIMNITNVMARLLLHAGCIKL